MLGLPSGWAIPAQCSEYQSEEVWKCTRNGGYKLTTHLAYHVGGDKAVKS